MVTSRPSHYQRHRPIELSPRQREVLKLMEAGRTNAEIGEILRKSIIYALEHRASAITHSMAHARGLDIPLVDRFIGMYVNELTLDYGENGRAAVRQFLGEAAEHQLIPSINALEFVN